MEHNELRNKILQDIISKMKNSLADKMFPEKEDVGDLVDAAEESPEHEAEKVEVEPHEHGVEVSKEKVGIEHEPEDEEHMVEGGEIDNPESSAHESEEEKLIKELMRMHKIG